MPTQKTFKRRVRARVAKTGESYTAARSQLLRKGDAPTEPAGPAQEPPPGQVSSARPPTSNDAVLGASGRTYEEWFALLDGWGAAERGHTQTAAWLVAEHAVDGWWAQSITVAYERARGLRAVHQMSGGFSVTATRTMTVDAERLLRAFTNAPLRRRWLPDAPMRQRRTTAANTARFDWSDPASRVVVVVVPKGPGKALVSVTHERLPDAASAERLKTHWRARLTALKVLLEAPTGRE